MTARTVIVGDVHGCLDELEDLLGVVAFNAHHDRLLSVGDLVGKGPAGAAVVRRFREGGHLAVRGNHEEKLLRHHRGERNKPLRASHLADAMALGPDDWAWLETLPLWIDLPAHDVCIVHAGRVPGLALSEHEPWMLLTMRSIRADGSPSKRIEDGEPWAATWPGPELVVFGHDAIRGLQRFEHAIGLDSGCVYGGTLSAYVLPEREVVSVPARRVYEEPGA